MHTPPSFRDPNVITRASRQVLIALLALLFLHGPSAPWSITTPASAQVTTQPTDPPPPPEPPKKTYKRLAKARDYRAAADLARAEFAASATKRTQKGWARLFAKARKAEVKTRLKAGKKAYKAKDFEAAVGAAAAADEAAAWTLPPGLTPAKPPKRKKRPKKPAKRPGDKIRAAVSKKLMKPVKVAMKRGDFVAAYAATAPIIKLFGDDPATETVVATVRSSVYRATDDHTSRGEYPQAHQLLELVARTEPRRAADVAARKSVVECEREVRTGAFKPAMKRAEDAIKGAREEQTRQRLASLFGLARGFAVKRQLDLGRQAIAKAHYEEAVNRAAAADRLDQRQLTSTGDKPMDKPAKRPGDGLRTQAHNALIAPSRAALARNDYAVAYAGLDPLFKVFPQDRDGIALQGAIRGRIYAESDALMRDNRFKKARKILALVERYEPQRRAEVDRRKQGIKVAKAEAFDRSAADAEAKGDELGAWALARRSATLGFAPASDRERRMRRRLRQRARYAVQLEMYGDAGRAKRHRNSVERILDKLPGMARGPKQRGRALSVVINVPWPRCFQTQRGRQTRTPYTTYRDVPNPRWGSAKRNKEDALARWRSADKDYGKAERIARAAIQKMSRCAADEGRMVGWQRRANNDVADAQRRLNLTKKMLKDNRRQLKKARADKKAGKKGADSVLLALTMTIGRLQQTEIKQGNKLYKGQQEAKKAAAALATAKANCSRVRKDQRSAESRRSQVASRRARLSGEYKTADRAFARTPKFNKVATKHFAQLQVTTVRRTCQATADVTIRGRKGKGQTQRFDHPRFTEDETHRGHVQARIKADPLKLRHSDATLVSDADGSLAKTVRRAVKDAVNNRYLRRLQRADAAWNAGRRHEAATTWLALWFGAPTRLLRKDESRLTQYLQQEFKLRSPLRR